MQMQNRQSELNHQSETNKIFGGILENWFIHIDGNNRFCVLGTNILTEDDHPELTSPVLYIDTNYWITETSNQFYLLGKKNTSAENKNFHYRQLNKLTVISPQFVLI